ncbi:MAG: hypothetical protein AB1724_19690 [Thermodesulfobacteriota bacterium]
MKPEKEVGGVQVRTSEALLTFLGFMPVAFQGVCAPSLSFTLMKGWGYLSEGEDPVNSFPGLKRAETEPAAAGRNTAVCLLPVVFHDNVARLLGL